MEQTAASEKAQNRIARELESRVVTQRPQAWRPPETLPSPDARPGWKHRWVRISTMGVADPSNISSNIDVRISFACCSVIIIFILKS